MKLALDHPETVDRLAVYDSAGVYFPATWQPELFTPTDEAGGEEADRDADTGASCAAGFCGGGDGAKAASKCMGCEQEPGVDGYWARSSGFFGCMVFRSRC